MERTIKTWGYKSNIFSNHLCEVSILDLVPYQRCSYHYHKSKWNLFYVIEGQLFIKTDTGIGEVNSGEVFTIRPGEFHEFQTSKEPCKAIEIMYVMYDSEDIEREELGGPVDKEELPSYVVGKCKCGGWYHRGQITDLGYCDNCGDTKPLLNIMRENE